MCHILVPTKLWKESTKENFIAAMATSYDTMHYVWMALTLAVWKIHRTNTAPKAIDRMGN